MRDFNSNTALMHAAIHGSADCVMILRDSEANYVNDEGETALVLAIKSDHLQCVELLVKEINKSANNETPFMIAAGLGFTGFFPLLNAQRNV